jgi:hypothetical protein
VTPSISARGRAAPGLEITPILKNGKGIAALQNGATLMGTFEGSSMVSIHTLFLSRLETGMIPDYGAGIRRDAPDLRAHGPVKSHGAVYARRKPAKEESAI